jgi:hypothetical protein
MTVRSRLLLLVLVAAAIASAWTATAPAGSPPTCRARNLRGHLYESNGAAGTIVLSITLTNRSSVCWLKGYTRLQLMANARTPLPTHVVHGGLAILNTRPRTVFLRHNGVASVLIAYSDVVHDGERSCPTGREILVRVPGDQTWIPVLAPTNACAHGTLEESPLLAGKRHAG